MIYKLSEPIIPENNPFENCKLNRRESAEILTNIVSQNPGCVLTIDSKWGYGKTTFVKMWSQSLRNKDFHVLYFNVWEHDFITDPIIGLVSQFRDMAESKEANDWSEKFLEAAEKVTTGILKSATKKILGDDVIKGVESAFDTISDSFNDMINNYISQCESMKEFRTALENLVRHTANGKKPLIFIIDELDRCNPRFAVKVLERIKHLFSVPNIVFILSIDKTQLCHSICGYYGSENLNAEEYLKRFIDIEYRLPKPNVDMFIDYLYDIYGFNSFFESREHVYAEGSHPFLKTAKILFKYRNLSLRQMEKIFTHISLTFLTFPNNELANPSLILMLIYFRVTDNSFYDKIISKRLSSQQIIDHIEETFPTRLLNNLDDQFSEDYTFIWEIARFLISYNWDKDENIVGKLIEQDISIPNGPISLLVKPKVIPVAELKRTIISYWNNPWPKQLLSLDYIIKHIELLSPI